MLESAQIELEGDLQQRNRIGSDNKEQVAKYYHNLV